MDLESLKQKAADLGDKAVRWLRAPKKDTDVKIVEGRKIERDTSKDIVGGVTFGPEGLSRFVPELDADGNEVIDEKTGKPKMVYADMMKIARRSKSKGFNGSGTGGANDPLIMWKPGASPRVAASQAMLAYEGLNFATISALSDEMSGIVWELYQIDAKGNHRQKFDHEILDLLDGVNEDQTGPELKFMMSAHLELAGNCYLLLLNAQGKPVKSDAEKPKQIHTLDPGKVNVVLDKTTYPYRVTGYDFRIDGREYHYEKYQVLQIKRPNPSNPWVGIGTTQCLADVLDLESDSLEFNRQFFLHGAYLTGTLETEMSTEDQIDSVRESFNEQHTGVQNANKVLILMKGMKFNPGLQPKDMAFDKLMDKTADRIHAGTRVSHTILGTAEADTNRATAETADYVFAKRLVKPRMQMICSYLNEFLVSRWGDNLYISFTDPTPEDKSFRIQEMTAALGGGGAAVTPMNLNEIREKYFGMGPVPGGDKFFVGGNWVDLNAPAAPELNPDGTPKPQQAKPEQEPTEPKEPDGNEEDNEGTPKEPKKTLAFRPTRVRFARNRHVREDAAKSLAGAIVEAVKRIHDAKAWRLSKSDYDVLQKESETRANDARKALEDGTVKFNNKQREEVLANLSKVMKAVDPTVLFDAKKWTSVMIDMATPILTDLAKAEGLNAAELITGAGIDVTQNATYMNALNGAIALLGQKYQETTLGDLKTTIEGELAKGSSIQQVTEAVRSYYSDANQYRAPMLAKTETFRISNSATKEAWKETGVVKSMKWFTSQHDNVCEFCQAMDGKSIPIDDNFFDQGDTFTVGDSTMSIDYSDVGGPPLHPNCGCYLQPDEVTVD